MQSLQLTRSHLNKFTVSIKMLTDRQLTAKHKYFDKTAISSKTKNEMVIVEIKLVFFLPAIIEQCESSLKNYALDGWDNF